MSKNLHKQTFRHENSNGYMIFLERPQSESQMFDEDSEDMRDTGFGAVITLFVLISDGRLIYKKKVSENSQANFQTYFWEIRCGSSKRI